MAIVKELKVFRNQTTGTYEINDTQNLLAFEPNSDTLWMNGKPYDYTTLNPVYDRPNTALQYMNSNRLNALTQNMVVSPYPVAYTALDQAVSESSTARQFQYQAFQTRRFNLDKSSQAGNMISFTSAQGVKHHLVYWHTPGGGFSNAYSRYQYYTTQCILIEGDNWKSPAASATFTIAANTAGTGLAYANYSMGVHPVAVDPTNKFIYCHQILSQNPSTTAYSSYYPAAFTKTVNIIKLPFTTRLDVGGALTVSAASGNVITNGATYSQHDFDSNPTFYCGLNNDNSPMFLTQVENDTIGGASTAVTSGNYTTYYSNKTQWTATRTNTSPKVYWDKLAAGVQTNVSSQNTASNTWGSTAASKPMYRYAPSKFEASTASGEADIKYAYNLCFDTTGNVPGLIYYKWNRATPASSTSGIMTIDWQGQTPADKIAHALPTAEANGTRTIWPEYVCAHTFLTKHGSRYFINVLHTWSYANMVTTKATAAAQKTLTTFEVNTTTWTSCTYVNSIGVTAYSYCGLDDNNTKIAVIRNGGVDVYTSNNGVWSITATEPGAISFVARDQSNRLWAIDWVVNSFDLITTTSDFTGTVDFTEIKPKIRLVSESLPNQVSVVLNDRSLTYSGSDISTTATVNAYNTSSARVATTVYLKISGANAKFTSNGSSEIEVSTSSSADTTVNITVIGSGYIQLSASFSL